MQAQFKAAETNGVPFAIFIGEDELAQGKIKIKEMGLKDGHPEKDGVLVDTTRMADELKYRIQRKKELESITIQAEGLRVVGGVKGNQAAEAEATPKVEEAQETQETPAADATTETPAP
jgi:histidyl-tRNA synthetase